MTLNRQVVVFVLSVVAFSLVCASRVNATGVFNPSTDFLIAMYSNTCLTYGATPHGVKEYLSTKGISALPEQYATPFLEGKTGTAWSIAAPFGAYVLVARNDGLCGIYAQEADVDEVEYAFTQLVVDFSQRSNQQMVKLADEIQNIGADRVHYQSYQLGYNKQAVSYHIALSTRAENKGVLQALLTFAPVAEPLPKK